MIELLGPRLTPLVRVRSVVLTALQMNRKPPEIVRWGDRFFYLIGERQYMEGLLYVVSEIDQVQPWRRAG